MLCTMLAGVASIPFFFLLICFRARNFKKDKLLGDKKGKTQNVAEDIAGAVDPDALSKHSAVEDAKGEKEDEGRELEEK